MIAGGVVHKGGFQGFPEKSLKFRGGHEYQNLPLDKVSNI